MLLLILLSLNNNIMRFLRLRFVLLVLCNLISKSKNENQKNKLTKKNETQKV